MHSALVLALLPLALGAPTSSERGTKLSIKPRATFTNLDGTVDWQRLVAHVNRTLVKYHTDPLPSTDTTAFRKRAGSNVPLTDQVEDGEDELYYGSGEVGSQSFTFDFDTGSADIFIPGPDCTSDDGCAGTARYDQSGASQSKQTMVTYGSGQVGGNDYKDDVTVGGLTSSDQGFISLTTAQGFSSSAADGLLGMGFSAIAETGFATFFESLISQGKVMAQEFSFYLGRSASQTDKNSELTLGGRDSSKYTGDITSVPVTTKGYWQVAIDSVKVNGRSTGATTEGQAAIDTGTTIVLAPTDAALAIFSAIPGALPLPLASESSILLFAYPCDTDQKYLPSLTFAGKDFIINALDFNLGTLSSGLDIEGFDETQGLDAFSGGYCVAGLGGADLDPTQNLYVVGDVFLKNWYSIYSYAGDASVNFAKAV